MSLSRLCLDEMIDMNKIEHNWDTFSKLLSRLSDQGINDLLKSIIIMNSIQLYFFPKITNIN